MGACKDYYTILGVKRTATSEEVKNAYFSKVKIVHPDHFEQHSPEWKTANELLSELNEAYSILSNMNKRQEYDMILETESASRDDSAASAPQSHGFMSSPIEYGEWTYGISNFDDLPCHVQVRLMNRQKGIVTDQIQIKIGSIIPNFVYAGMMFGWFGILLGLSQGSRWNSNALLLYITISCIASYIFSRNIIKIVKWYKSYLKSFFYLTPLYFVKTSFDVVQYIPLWMLKNISIIHNYKNGVYEDSTVNFSYTSGFDSIKFPSKSIVDLFCARLNEYRKKMTEAFLEENIDYFRANDDFYKVQRTNKKINKRLSIKWLIALYTCPSLLFCLIFIFAFRFNIKYYNEHWYKHNTTTPTVRSAVTKPKPPVFSVPEKPFPAHGSIQLFSSEKCMAPLEINTSADGYYLLKLSTINSNKSVITIFIHGGRPVKVDVPLGDFMIKYAFGHKWYGYEYLFGPDTVYTKADEIFHFRIENNHVIGYTLTLYSVYDGNLETISIDPSDF